MKNQKLDLKLVIFWSNLENRKEFAEEMSKKAENKWYKINTNKEFEKIETILEEYFNKWLNKKEITDILKISITLSKNIESWYISIFSLLNVLAYSMYFLWENNELTKEIIQIIKENDFKNKIDKLIILNDKNYLLNDVTLKVKKLLWKDKNVIINFLYK